MCMFENDFSNYWLFCEGGTLFANDVVFIWSHIIFRNVLEWCVNFILEGCSLGVTVNCHFILATLPLGVVYVCLGTQ
jgi:hypothetical protein